MTSWKNGIAKLILPTPYPVGDVNVYLIKGERLTLVDAGPKTDEAWARLAEQLRHLGLKISDIEQVILTHHHPDHSGLLKYLPESIEVYGHPVNDRWLCPTDEFLAEQEEFFRKIYIEFGIPKEFMFLLDVMKKGRKYLCLRTLDGYLNEGDSPNGLSDWKVIETPGHAQSHIGLYREKDGVYIGGDQLLARITPNPLIEPPVSGEQERPRSMLQYNHSMKKLLDIPIDVVYPGHGEDIYNKDELIPNQMLKQHERAYKVKKWLENETLTVFEACRRLFPKVYKRELPLTISETVAQFDYLADLKEIHQNNREGVFFYSARKVII